jgi:hypothetical protein
MLIACRFHVLSEKLKDVSFIRNIYYVSVTNSYSSCHSSVYAWYLENEQSQQYTVVPKIIPNNKEYQDKLDY